MNSYEEAIQMGAQYKRIFLTGPQRSGTTFASHCLAKDLNIEHIDENMYGIDNVELLEKEIKGKTKWVVHGPGLFPKIKNIADRFPTSCIIVMRRNINDIIKSQKRINWNEQAYKVRNNIKTLEPISQETYQKWNRMKQQIDTSRWREVYYLDMETHPLWINPSKRKNFSPRQWRLDC